MHCSGEHRTADIHKSENVLRDHNTAVHQSYHTQEHKCIDRSIHDPAKVIFPLEQRLYPAEVQDMM